MDEENKGQEPIEESHETVGVESEAVSQDSVPEEGEESAGAEPEVATGDDAGDIPVDA